MVSLTTVGIIQARMSSTRLPGKIIAPLAGRTALLDVLVQRLAGSGVPWWLATTDHPSDDVTAEWGDTLGLEVFRGSEEDVLSRFTAIIDRTNADLVVRATADNPFTDGTIVRRLIELAKGASERIDAITAPRCPRWFPLGFVPEVVRARSLLQLDYLLTDPLTVHRTHVTSALDPGAVAPYHDQSTPARPDWRWTVDTAEDLTMARAAFAAIGDGWETATYQDIVRVLDRYPEICAMNQHVRQKPLEEG